MASLSVSSSHCSLVAHESCLLVYLASQEQIGKRATCPQCLHLLAVDEVRTALHLGFLARVTTTDSALLVMPLSGGIYIFENLESGGLDIGSSGPFRL